MDSLCRSICTNGERCPNGGEIAELHGCVFREACGNLARKLNGSRGVARHRKGESRTVLGISIACKRKRGPSVMLRLLGIPKECFALCGINLRTSSSFFIPRANGRVKRLIG